MSQISEYEKELKLAEEKLQKLVASHNAAANQISEMQKQIYAQDGVVRHYKEKIAAEKKESAPNANQTS